MTMKSGEKGGSLERQENANITNEVSEGSNESNSKNLQ
jgi:hypothetical protein